MKPSHVSESDRMAHRMLVEQARRIRREYRATGSREKKSALKDQYERIDQQLAALASRKVRSMQLSAALSSSPPPLSRKSLIQSPLKAIPLLVSGSTVAIAFGVIIVAASLDSDRSDSVVPGANWTVPEYSNSLPSTSPPSYTGSEGSNRSADIDRYVDEMADKYWRPMPGGNSKEDAKWVTRDILSVKSWEEFEEVAKFHIENGR